MLSEEVANTAVSVVTKVVELTPDAVMAAIRGLAKLASLPAAPKHGFQTLRQLNAQGVALTNIPISDIDIAAIKTDLKKMGVDFAIMKNPLENSYELFFKGRDVDQIHVVMKNYAAAEFQKKKEEPIKEKVERAQQTACERNEQVKEKQHDRGDLSR